MSPSVGVLRESSKHVVADVVMRADIETALDMVFVRRRNPFSADIDKVHVVALTSIEDEDLGPSNSAGEGKRTLS